MVRLAWSPVHRRTLALVTGDVNDAAGVGGPPDTRYHASMPQEVPEEIVRVPGLEGRARSVAVVGVVLVVAVGIVLRFDTRSALWLDEALTVNISSLPLHTIPGALRDDGAPPAYYVLLHFWMQVFGTSDLATRSLAGVIGVGVGAHDAVHHVETQAALVERAFKFAD